MPKLTGDFNVCMEEANMFYNIAKYCNDMDLEDYMTKGFYTFVVNVSFACELYIKAIMMKNSQNIDEFERGHELEKLFNLLDDNCKEKVKDRFEKEYGNGIFNQFLSDNNNAFIDWRYALEHSVRTNINHFFSFATILKEFVEENMS